MLEAVMIKQACRNGLTPVLTRLYNGCREYGVFPETWKGGIIRVILKNVQKDPTQTKSYRPICLLSILSKVLEKLVQKEIKPTIVSNLYASDRQYGYHRCNTIQRMREIATGLDSNIVFAILFDVTGAFDNLRWASIHKELERRQCPADMKAILTDYFNKRTVKIEDNYKQVERRLSKGYPQGSVLGPDLWNICLDPLLKEIEENEGEVIAYADDIIVIIGGDSRAQIERKGQLFTDMIMRWSIEQRCTYWFARHNSERGQTSTLYKN